MCFVVTDTLARALWTGFIDAEIALSRLMMVMDGMQGHMMWVKRQEAFRHKFGDVEHFEGVAAVGQKQVEEDHSRSLS